MLKFQILPGQQLVNFVKNGQPGTFIKQQAIVTLPDGSAGGAEVLPPKGAQPYQPGAYVLDPSTSFYFSRGRLEFSPKLIPAQASK